MTTSELPSVQYAPHQGRRISFRAYLAAFELSHVAEHLPNPGLFFDKLFHDVRDGGWAVITVPPLKHLMTFAHVTLWNAGLLLIHLVRAGFDARDAHVATYGYNVTVLAKKCAGRPAGPLKNFLPAVTWSQPCFEGRIDFLNWVSRELPLNAAMPTTPLSQAMERLSAAPPKTPHLFSAIDPKSRSTRNFYFDPHSRLVCSVG